MTEKKITVDDAIRILERLQEPEPYEPQITADVFYALDLAIQALRARPNNIHWFDANVAIPDEGISVLTYTEGGIFDNSFIADDEGSWFDKGVVAWTWLPDKPNELIG